MTKSTATTATQINDLMGGMQKNNRAERAGRLFASFF